MISACGAPSGGLVEQRSGESAAHIGTFGAPQDLAGVLVDGDEEGAGFGIAVQDDPVAGQQRRGAHAEGVIERSQGEPPALVAVRPVGDETEIGKEGVDVPAIGDGARRGGAVGLVEFLLARAGEFPTPARYAGLAVEMVGEKVRTVPGRDEDGVADKDR